MLTGLLAVVMIGLVPRTPIPLHYRVELKSARRIDRTPADTSGGDFTAIAFMSATLRDTAGGQVGRVVIDSVTCSGTGLLSMAYDPVVGRQSAGAWYDVVLLAGRPEQLPRPSIRNPLTEALAQVTLELFPPVHRRSAAGDSWVDTLDIRTATDRWSESRPAVTRWKVVSNDGAEEAIEGDVTVIVAVSGQVSGTGMIVGKRRMAIMSDGAVRSATLSTTERMLAAAANASAIRTLQGITTASVTLLSPAPRP